MIGASSRPLTHPTAIRLDAVIVLDGTSYPGIVILCRVIGVLNVEQTNRDTKRCERNDRIVVLPVEAPRQAHIASVFDLTQRERDELEQFFLHSVVFQGKDLELLGWDGADKAQRMLRRTKSPHQRQLP